MTLTGTLLRASPSFLRGVDVSDPGIIAQAFAIDNAAATEYVAEHELATTEAEKRARRLLEADGDEGKAREKAVAEYRKALTEALDMHVRKVLQLHDEVFKYTHNTLSISSLEGVPTFRLYKTEEATEGHGDTWSSFQDRYVGAHSSHYLARPWERVEESQHRRLLEIEDEMEDMEKKKNESFGNRKRQHPPSCHAIALAC